MKTYRKDYSINNNSSSAGDYDELREVIINRHEKCATTVEYKEVYDEIYGSIKELEDLLPNGKRVIMGLEEALTALEGICYNAAYRDGMNDLMTAMTFNKLGITNAEFPSEGA